MENKFKTVPETLGPTDVKDLYKQKNRRGIRELVAKFHTDHYQLFTRFVIDTNNKSYIKWFLTSGVGIYTEIIKDIYLFNNYQLLHKLVSIHGFNLKAYKHLCKDNKTMIDIIDKKVPYEKCSMALYRWRKLIRKYRTLE